MTPALARAARAFLRWTVIELAERVGVGESTIRDFERGRKDPRPLTKHALGVVFLAEGITFRLTDGLPSMVIDRPGLAEPPQRKRGKRGKPAPALPGRKKKSS